MLFALSCKGSKEKSSTLTVPEHTPKITDTIKQVSKKGPIINIVDTVEVARKLLCVKDSAITLERMNEKLAAIFNLKLPEAAMAGKVKMTGVPIVWYTTKKAPYFFQAGIQVDKTPVKIAKGMFMAKTGGDSAFVAHFFGPEDLKNIGYETLNEVCKDHNKKMASDSYEVYIDNKFLSSKEKVDPYKLQTDIVMPYK